MINPASIDLRLGTTFRVPKKHRVGTIDLAAVPDADETSELVVVPLYYHDGPGDGSKDPGRGFIIHPGEFVLGSTLEYLRIPEDISMVIDGKSSIGRLGLAVHVTAGFFDPGFHGIGTLEMVNLSPYPIILRPGMRICQSRWMRMERPPAIPYQGRYQGDTAATGSRYGQ
jgi:dCTP deaminase